METITLPESAMTPEDYIRCSAGITGKMYQRRGLVSIGFGLIMFVFFVITMASRPTSGPFPFLFAMFSFVMLYLGFKLVTGMKSSFATVVKHPDNSGWFEPRSITLSNAGIETVFQSGRSGFLPWSEAKRWTTDSTQGITIYFSQYEFLFLPNEALPESAREYLVRHLSTYATEVR